MNLPSFELSMEQQFQLQRLQQEYNGLERADIVSRLLDTMQQLMDRDNSIREIMKKVPL